MSTESADFELFFAERIKAAERYTNGDPAPLVALVPAGGPSTFHSPQGPTYDDAGAVSEVYARQGAAFAAGGESELVVLQKGASGDLAFWTGFQIARVRQAADGPQREMRIRVTEAFRKIDGAWKLVHRHADLGAGG